MFHVLLGQGWINNGVCGAAVPGLSLQIGPFYSDLFGMPDGKLGRLQTGNPSCLLRHIRGLFVGASWGPSEQQVGC